MKGASAAEEEDEECEGSGLMGRCHDADGKQQRKPKLSSDKEKEKTKIRERHRRSITTNILTGLRKHGNYNLPPRADINDVLRALAREAGWIVEADGTTYRNPALQHTFGLQSHPFLRQPAPLSRNPSCLTPASVTPTPSSSSMNSMGGFSCSLPVILTEPVDLTGGECSTTSSPRHLSSALGGGLPQPNSVPSSPGHLSNSIGGLVEPSSISSSPRRLSSSVGGLVRPNSIPSSHRHLSSSLGGLVHASGIVDPFTSAVVRDAPTQAVQLESPIVLDRMPTGCFLDEVQVLVNRGETTMLYSSADALEAREMLMARSSCSGCSPVENQPSTPFWNQSGGLCPMQQLGSMLHDSRTGWPSMMMYAQQNPFLQESRASNQNTPIGSPQPHVGDM